MSTQSSSLAARLTPPLWLFTLLLAVVVSWILFELKELVSLLVVGYAIAYVINPLLSALERYKVPRTIGFFALMGAAIALVILLAATALPTISRQYAVLTDNLPGYVTQAKERFAGLAEQLNLPIEHGSIREILQTLPTPSGETVKGFVRTVGTALLSGYSVTMTLLNLALLPFLVFYIAVDWRSIHAAVLSLFQGVTRARIMAIGGEINGYVSAFVRGQITIGIILTTLYAIGLGAFVGVELWFLIAVIAGMGSLIPYFGLITGVLLGSIMALVTFGDLQHLIYTWLVFIVVQFVTDTFITPKVVGAGVGLSPLVVILALLAGGQLFGLLGLFLAIPITAALRVLFTHLHSRLT